MGALRDGRAEEDGMLDELEGWGDAETAGGAPSIDESVRFELEVGGTDTAWLVQRVALEEAVSEPLRGVVEARVPGDAPPVSELLGRAFALRIERGSELRTVRGIVRHASTARVLADSRVILHVVSSLWRLGLGIDTRTYRDKTVPQLVEAVIGERLGRAVTVDAEGLTSSYEVHEMLVQYRESPLAFISRWMEQEGIYYYLVDGEDGERMVLADAVESLPFARSSEDGRVPHRGEDGVAPDGEHVSDLRHAEGLGVTHVALSEHDWTNPALRVHAGHGGEGPPDPAAATYDHADAIGFHRYDGRQYAHNSATRSARIRAEAANLARQRWTLRSNVVTAQPGHVVNVEGAPDGDLDGAYMIVRCDSHGEAREGGTGSWRSSHAVAPTSVPYRPAPRTPRPLVSGPETAFVVGPAGEEIHTDEHGRVMVQFHWDRARGHDESSTCWIRVAQSSAGEGFGTFFLPRIGMEVVVDFLGGNPDRPLVTGCVHNGGNLAQVNLPADRTQSYIRTRSSIGSSGYNEIRFEDRDGAEFISLHAQRNLIERVVNDHTTHVGNDHTNRVDGNDRETVQFDQELTVGQSRWKTVGRNETNVIRGERMTTVGEEGGNDVLHVINNRNVRIDGFRDVDVANGDLLHVHGGQDVTIDQGLNTTVANGVTQTITSGGWTMTTTGDVVHGISGHFALNAGQSVNLRSGTEMTLDATSALRVKAQTVTIASDTSVNVRAPAGIQHITPASETNVFTEAYHTIQNKFENILGKFAAYTIAMSIYGMKVDISGVKVDFYGCKLDNSTFKAKKQDITIDNSLTVNINVAAIVLIG